MNPIIRGTVADGNKIGRKIGFPTANIPLRDDDTRAGGVYTARVRTADGEYGAVVNIGRKPTLGAGQPRVLEAHLLDFDGDLYGQTIEVELLKFLREERRFGSFDELARQIEADRRQAREYFRKGEPR